MKTAIRNCQTLIKTFVAILALALFAGNSYAGYFQVTELFTEGFESPDTTNPNPLETPTGWTWVTGNATSQRGVYATVTPYGDQVFYGYAGSSAYAIQTTSAILSDTVAAGAEYTVSLNYQGYAGDRQIIFEVRLLADDGAGGLTELGSASVDEAGGIMDMSGAFTFTTGPVTTNIGESLVIEIKNQRNATAGAQLDNLILSSSVYIPEPSTAILAGLGLMGVCFRRRRRK